MEAIQEEIIRVNKKDVIVKDDNLVIRYKGKEYVFAFEKISKRLAKASKKVRENFTVSSSGYGIHWEGADEDLSIGGLLKPFIKKYRAVSHPGSTAAEPPAKYGKK